MALPSLPSSPWFFDLKPSPNATTRCFCFPYLGGQPASFLDLAKILPDSIHLVGIHYPGRGKRFADSLIESNEEIVKEMGDALAPVFKQQQKPPAFFGYSMGAILAMDTAQYLKEHFNVEPLCTICAASTPKWDTVSELDPPLWSVDKETAVKLLREAGGLPDEVMASKELLDMLLPVWLTDSKLCELTDDQKEAMKKKDLLKLDCPIFAYGGLQDKSSRGDGMALWDKYSTDPDNKSTLRMFDSGHFFLTSHTAQLADMLARDILGSLK